MLESLFNKVFQTLLKTLQHRCFPVKFVKFLRLPFSTEHLQWLLLSKETPTQVLTCGICEIFKDTFFGRTTPVAASEWTPL